jgi:putative hemolysin
MLSQLSSQRKVAQQPQEGNISGCEESSQAYCQLKGGEASSVSRIGFKEKMKVELWS